MLEKTRNIHLTANTLKMIAIIAMTLDHIVWRLYPGFQAAPLLLLLHIPGRLTAPIMMFFIVEGYHHTRNLKKYITRMFLLAVISHFAFAIFLGQSIVPFRDGFFEQTSVIWGFLMGLLSLSIWKRTAPALKPWLKILLITLCILLAFPANWSAPAALAILFMGITYGNFRKQMFWLVLCIFIYSVVYISIMNVAYGVLQMGIVLAIPLLACYHGERGTWKPMKWLFYFYYPVHLWILGIIRIFLIER